jgi:outer membrane protein
MRQHGSLGSGFAAIGLAALLNFGTALAQPPPRTLQEAFALSYANNPTLLSERAHLRSVDENVPQALAGWRPTVIFQGSAGYAWGHGDILGAGAKTNRLLGAATGTLTQPLYTGGRTHAQTSQAENTVMAERARLLAAEQQVFTDTVNAYVAVIQDKQVLALNINNEQVLTKQLQATNDRFRVGEITRTDVAQAEAALAQARAQRQTAEGTLQTARATFRQVIGADPPDDLIEPQPLQLPTKTEQEAMRLAAANNPNVVAALFDDSSAKDAIDVAFSKLMPNVNLEVTQFDTPNSQIPHTSSYGGQAALSLSVPIYQGGSEYSAVRQARQTEQQTRKTLDLQRLTAIQAATSAWETVIADRAAIASDRAAIRANEIALEGVQREAIVGSRTTLDVLNAEQALLNSRVTLVQALAQLVTATYSMASAVGRLTAHDLGLPVVYYDPTAYYRAVRNKWVGTGDYATGQPGR